MEKIFQNNNGFIEENQEDTCIRVMQKKICNEDGVISSGYNELRINYKTGLYQLWSTCGYRAEYYDWCKERKAVISHGKRMLKEAY